MWWGYHHGLGFFPFLFPFGVFILVALCLIVTRIVMFKRFGRFNQMSCRGNYGPWNGEREAEAILKRRLASGEITEAEYKQLKAVLKGDVKE
jgi:uncharacterized membrane protein